MTQQVSVSVRNTAILITSVVETILLIGTYLAGVAITLWVPLPSLPSVWMSALISVHFSLALLSGLGAALLFVLSYLSNRKELFYLSLITLVSVGFAAAMGQTFYRTGDEPFSYAMGMTVVIPIASTVGCLVYSL